jgi:hypothetical protein
MVHGQAFHIYPDNLPSSLLPLSATRLHAEQLCGFEPKEPSPVHIPTMKVSPGDLHSKMELKTYMDNFINTLSLMYSVLILIFISDPVVKIVSCHECIGF